ncbi:sugar phosphate isomerase/epimerase [Kribbella voronezhensis]|uniref:Sugar phosphate isomerase/epimerase n=1 Tax=Kribbella voronezhensis TaxID=2512212 RepID=A0A4R7TEW8_9ACTN|nr:MULTISPECIES: TIM barrel protein [Kribbella]TDU90730.1 sugar phosphate isomerase/epimerase [Kribbella voronezhensis]
MAVRTGLVSVTFRQLAVEEVVEVADQAGLAAIEWGGDVHVPLGDLPAARKARALCEDRGLAIAAYGSYLRAGSVDREEIRTAVTTAVELGAPRIRVWAGTVGTAEAGVGDRMAVTRGLAELADVAAGSGIEIAMEFHRNTLTDEVDSTITLLLDVGAPNLTTYWQPPVDLDDAECLQQLEALMPWLSTVHVFSWWPSNNRLPLAARESLWRPVLDRLAAEPREINALLEFVADDSVSQLTTDAADLHSWV